MAKKTPQKPPAEPAPAAPAAPSPVIEEVRQLVRLMVDHDLGEVSITDGDRRILVRRGAACLRGMPLLSAGQFAAAAPAAPSAPAAAAPAKLPETLLEIRSPMVGTFYAAPSPENDPYVAVGTRVDDDTVVCIVEAMKVMNEMKAECSGTIAEVCVKDAQPVEYGQVLFRVRPA